MLVLFAAIAFISVGMIFVLHRKATGASPYGVPGRNRIVVAPGEGHLALARRWGNDDPALAPTPDAERRVAELEQRYGISIPEEFRLYLLTTAPSGYYMDEIGTAWWTLAEIKNIPDECGKEAFGDRGDPVIAAEEDRYLVFADFLVWCYAWAICCADGEHRGKIAVITGGGGDRFVAHSFAQFVEMELNDESAVHPGAGGGSTTGAAAPPPGPA